MLLIWLTALLAPPGTLHGQGPLSAVVGIQSPTDGSGEGMIGGDLRLGLGPRGWAVRPSIGVAGAMTLYASQTELQLGADTDFPLGRRWSGGVGGGISYLWLDGGASTGSSAAGYLRAAVLYTGFRGADTGLDVRLLAGPDRRRQDGLHDPVGYVQVGAILVFRGRSQAAPVAAGQAKPYDSGALRRTPADRRRTARRTIPGSPPRPMML